jgi:UDP-glucuronate 4-epimerase
LNAWTGWWYEKNVVFMRILVTGAAGFIGYHLVRRLLGEGNQVVGLDNINDYYDVRLKYARLKESGIEQEEIEYGKPVQSKIHEQYRFIRLNIEDVPALKDLFAVERFDIVCHLAAQAGVRYSIENPYAYINSNIVGFINILECCRHHAVKHLVYASSSSVYGNNEKVPFSENDRVDYPVSLYAATKKANELMAHTYSHLYQLPATGLRFFTVYGPWGRPDMAPMLFAKAITEGKPVRVFNNGDLSRDFTYIDDIIEGVIKVIGEIPTKEETHPYYRIFNIGNSQPVQLMKFIQIMEETVGKKAILKMYPMQKGDVCKTYADTSELRKRFDYLPSTSLEKGIEQFIYWYKQSKF